MGRNVSQVIATLMNSLDDFCCPTDTGFVTEGPAYDQFWRSLLRQARLSEA